MTVHASAPKYTDQVEQLLGVERGAVAADPIIYPSTTGGFFSAAANGVATGAIPNGGSSERPQWLDGVCWRPAMCADIECEFIDCGCPDGPEECAPYDLGEPVPNQTAKAFEVTLRDRLGLCSTPVSADAMRMRLGKAFGQQLWKQVDAEALPVPPAVDGNCIDPAAAVGLLEYDTGFCGTGTLLAPALLLPYLCANGCLFRDGNQFRTAAGNRVITEGVGIAGAAGQMNIYMVGPVDYARTGVMEDEEAVPDRKNERARRLSVFGLVRTDLCAAKRVCVVAPNGCVAPEGGKG